MKIVFPEIEEILRDIVNDCSLGNAIKHCRSFLKEKAVTVFDERVNDIDSQYSLLKDYMLRGYKDDKREELYREMLYKLYTVLFDVERHLQIKEDSYFTSAVLNSRSIDFQNEDFQNKLEGFVQEAAMLSLEPEPQRADKVQYLFTQHQQYISSLFDAILVSGYWTPTMADKMQNLLLSPMVDTSDVLLLESAIYLSMTNMPDRGRILTLLTLFTQAQDEAVRQRALVGWVLSIDDDMLGFLNLKKSTDPVFGDDDTRRQILELQEQIMLCADAEKDNATLQKDVIPNIMKNNGLKMNRFGITEKDDDNTLNEILHPDADDIAMEEMEKSINKMKNMQKQGADIYFGGFSQMKRFPFFKTMSNWFAPFNIEHPELKRVCDKLKDTRIMDYLMKSGTFCDSDKYSFAFAMNTVIDQLPANIMEMMKNGDTELGLGDYISDDMQNSASFIRLKYLQDLYRFHRLNYNCMNFGNPFDFLTYENKYIPGLFLSRKTFSDHRFADITLKFSIFLLKRKKYSFVELILDRYRSLAENKNALRVLISAFMGQHDYFKAITNYFVLFDIPHDYALIPTVKSDRESDLCGFARALFNDDNYEAASALYDKLLIINPGKLEYQLNKAVADCNIEDSTEKGIKSLERLSYENPGNVEVMRAYAYALMDNGSYDKAEVVYDSLMLLDNINEADYFNVGCCKWYLNKINEAVILFRKFTSETDIPFAKQLKSEKSIFYGMNLSDYDISIMSDIVGEN